MPVAYGSVASSLTGTCTKPASTASGDMLVAHVYGAGSSSGPAGWTKQIEANVSATYHTSLWTKVAGGSEPADYTWTATVIEGVQIVRLTGGGTIEGTPTSGSSSLTAGSITTTSADTMLVYGGVSTATLTPDASMTERAENGPGSTLSFYGAISTEARASAGATGSRAATTGGSALMAVMLAVGPPSSSGVTVSAGLAGNTTRAHLAPTAVTGGARATPAVLSGRTASVLAATAFERVHVTVTPSLLSGVTHDILAPTITFGSTIAAPVAGGTTRDVLPVGSVGVGSTITPALLDGVTRALLAPDILTGATMVASVAGGISRALYAPTVGILLPRQTFDGSVLTTDGASPVRGVSTDANGIRGRTTDGVPGVRGRLP